MKEAKQLVRDIQQGQIKPIYLLMGEEPYFIDKISRYIEDKVLNEEEKGFNQVIIYGRDSSIEDIVSQAKRYPMMAERQVVIVKEAQDLSRTIDKLEAYAENPQPSTVLVLCYKYKKVDKRKKVYKAIAKNGVVLESKKLYENQVSAWLQDLFSRKEYQIEPKALQMMIEFLGTDLGKIENEVDKLTLLIPKGTIVTPLHIEENIGFSKDYNNFELRKAIGVRDVQKAFRIIMYFSQNPKDNPFVVTVSLLFSFFSQVMKFHGTKDQSPKNVARLLGISPYFVTDYVTAAKNYPMKKISQIFSILRSLDVQGKGVGAYNRSQEDLLKEMLVRIMS